MKAPRFYSFNGLGFASVRSCSAVLVAGHCCSGAKTNVGWKQILLNFSDIFWLLINNTQLTKSKMFFLIKYDRMAISVVEAMAKYDSWFHRGGEWVKKLPKSIK